MLKLELVNLNETCEIWTFCGRGHKEPYLEGPEKCRVCFFLILYSRSSINPRQACRASSSRGSAVNLRHGLMFVAEWSHEIQRPTMLVFHALNGRGLLTGSAAFKGKLHPMHYLTNEDNKCTLRTRNRENITGIFFFFFWGGYVSEFQH